MSTLTDEAHRRLRKMLFKGELVGGSLVSEKELAERLQTSRMPVRGAVARLASEGFVSQEGRVGTRILKPSREDIVGFYELREVIEPYAIRQIIEQRSDVEIKTLAEVCEKMADYVAKTLPMLRSKQTNALDPEQERATRQLDAEFHLKLVQLSGNRQAFNVARNSALYEQLFLNGVVDYPSKTLHRLVWGYYRKHRAIIRATLKRDTDRAAAMLTEHVRVGLRNALWVYDSMMRKEILDDDLIG